ncbi:MAG: hypothetical protein ABJL99_20230 [Aliishimia sp.]
MKKTKDVPQAQVRHASEHNKSSDDVENGHNLSLSDPVPINLSGHYWMLDVCDDLIEYCETHDLGQASNSLRYVIVGLVRDMDRSLDLHPPQQA